MTELEKLRIERHQLQNDLTAAGLENERLRRGVPLEYSEHCECCRRNKITLQVFSRPAAEPSKGPTRWPGWSEGKPQPSEKSFSCVCGEPNRIGVQHRTDGPCIVITQR